MSAILLDPEAAEASLPPEFHGFFAGLSERRIAFPRCRACDRSHWYPMKRCPHCYGSDIGWEPVAGEARLQTWTTVMRAFSATFADDVPYVVGLVEFPELPGIRLIARIVGAHDAELVFDLPLAPVFAEGADRRPSVAFQPAGRDAP